MLGQEKGEPGGGMELSAQEGTVMTLGSVHLVKL